ncbi:MAG TPA: cytochrome C [Oceanospirillaceae bacterium]|nr:cytochrome C [Oceanospirillaceae bacterium]
MNTTFKTVILLLTTFTLANPLYAAHNISHVDVKVGDLSVIASKGQMVFNTNCAQCHGVDAAGGVGGPPLIHNIYNPGHHANEAFIRAVRNGVRQHHWQFGDMSSQPQVAFGDMVFLLKFIREVQQQNGIKTIAHKM